MTVSFAIKTFIGMIHPKSRDSFVFINYIAVDDEDGEDYDDYEGIAEKTDFK